MAIKKVIFLTWPTPYAMRFAWDFWLQNKNTTEIAILDFTPMMNRVLKDFELRAGSRILWLTKLRHSFHAMSYVASIFWLKALLDEKRFKGGRVANRNDFLNSKLVEQFIQHVTQSLIFTNSSLPESRFHSLKAEVDSLCRKIVAEIPEEVVAADDWIIFSGRFPIDGMLRLFRLQGSGGLSIFEGGSLPNTHIIRRDLWSSTEARKDIARLWLKSSAQLREKGAHESFIAMSSGSSDLQEYWSGHQRLSYVNTSGKDIVTFFASNEDEMLPDALVEDPYSMDTQSGAISWVIEQCLSKNLHVVIKEHPFPPNHDYRSEVISIFREFRNHNSVDILDGHSKISSSSLINQSKFCITFGSSVGVQIIAAGKPLLVLGPNTLLLR
jgi:hypothetical protein